MKLYYYTLFINGCENKQLGQFFGKNKQFFGAI